MNRFYSTIRDSSKFLLCRFVVRISFEVQVNLTVFLSYFLVHYVETNVTELCNRPQLPL
jgi:hypothetical protein